MSAIKRLSALSVLNDKKTEAVLTKLYKAVLRQSFAMIWHFLPKAVGLLRGKGMDWKTENVSFYDDKYVSILPEQGIFLTCRPGRPAQRTSWNLVLRMASRPFSWLRLQKTMAAK